MLPPVTVNRSLNTLAQAATTTSQRTLVVTSSRAAVPTRQNAGTVNDLAAEIAAQLEQDVDYQILRKSFDLESKTSLHPHARNPVATAQANAVTANQNAVALELHIATQQHSTTRVTVAATQQQTSGFVLAFESQQRQSVSVTLEVSNDHAAVLTSDPLVLDLSGAGITTTGVENGAQFDLNADGQTEQVSMASGDTWFLAVDRNGNGHIDDGGELFGDQHGAAHGFAELARYDADANGQADGVIDANDVTFAQLRLLQMNSDGTQVTKTLEEAQVVALELGHQNTRKALNLYDTVSQTSHFRREDGSTGEAADVLLGYRSIA